MYIPRTPVKSKAKPRARGRDTAAKEKTFQKIFGKEKILLAKRVGIVYKYSTQLNFFTMKKYLLPLAVAALCGFPTASALDAESVQVTFKAKPGDLKVERLNLPTPGADVFNGKDMGKRVDDGQIWHFVRVPLTVEGKAKGGKSPNFIPELKVHIYTVFVAAKGETPIMLDKEITYVDIPLTPQNGNNPSKNDINVGVFISPSNAVKILDEPNKVDFSNKLAAVAVEASFHDASCINKEVEPAVVISHDLASKLNGTWWKKNAKNKNGAALSSIAETPYAPFYAPMFPATSPMYGAAAPTASSSATGDSTTGMDDTTSTPSATDTATDTATDDGTDDMTTGKGKKKKNKKNK